MIITRFPTNKHYILAQKGSRKRKKPDIFCFDPAEVSLSYEYYSKHGIHPARGICHGAMQGEEIDRFEEMFGEGNVSCFLGTDLWPMSGHPKVKKWDFRRQKKEWIGYFTLLFSNSLDHSDEPFDTVSIWGNQLCEGGLAFIQWNNWSVYTKWGDCFGATLHEYIGLLKTKMGPVVDLLWVGGKHDTTMIVVKKK